MKKTVCVTGAAGLLGSRLVEWILDHTDYAILAVDDLSGGYVDNLPKSSRIAFLDIDAASDELEHGFSVLKPEYVFHFAAYAAECVSPFIRKFNYQNNLIATANIINLCIRHNAKRLVFTSSMAVYGDAPAPFHEDMVPNPIDPYGVAKYAAEMDIRIAGDQHGLDWCIIRPHNVYGRKQNLWDSYRNFIGICMYKILNDQPVTIYGDGLQTRAFSYIDDSLAPLWRAATEPHASKQIINLGGIKEYSILETAETVIKVAGFGKMIFLPPRHEVKHAWASWEKSVEILGFEHKTDLEEGIKDMWSWARIQPHRDRFVWEKYEVDKGLYPYWEPAALKDPSLLKVVQHV
jgi:UDP-glucose 4-epimerase